MGDREGSQKIEKSLLCCSRWPLCSRGDNCKYYHPQLPCLAFPNCPFANECLLIHPIIECPDGSSCKKVKCNYSHPPPETRNSRGTICKYHPKCTNRECPYLHPEVPLNPVAAASGVKPQNMTICKFGVLCTRAECYFYHPEPKILPQTGGYPPTPKKVAPAGPSN